MPNTGVIEQLRRLLNPNRANPLYGRKALERIRRHGATFLEPYFGGGKEQGLLQRTADRLGKNKILRAFADKLREISPHAEIADNIKQRLINSKKFIIPGSVVSREQLVESFPGMKLTNTSAASKPLMDELNKIEASKVHEAKHFKGIGRTDIMSVLLKQRRTGEQLHDTLNRIYGKKGWVAKTLNGNATIRTRGTKDPQIFFSHDANASNISSLPENQLDNWLVQPNKQLTSTSRGRKILDKLLFSGKLNRGMSGMNEYRVHVINGRVVPYATVHRGSASRALMDPFMPWRSGETKAVESYAQKQINALKNKHLRKGTYGFDIAMDAKGKPQLIETNPAAAEGASGFYVNPTVQDSIVAAAEGRLPYHVMARRAAYGGLATGAGALGLSKLMQNSKDNNELAKTATSFGATRNLLRQLASEGIKVTRDPKTFLSLEKGRGAASLLSKDLVKARTKVDPAKFIPKPAQKGGTGTIYVGKDLKNHPALQEDIKNFKDYVPSPREALFHEAGHGIHHLEDPAAFLNTAETHTENIANELARERIANNNAINFMRSNKTPASLIERYKKNLGTPFKAYTDYAKNVAAGSPDYKGTALNNSAHFSVEKQSAENPRTTNLLLQTLFGNKAIPRPVNGQSMYDAFLQQSRDIAGRDLAAKQFSNNPVFHNLGISGHPATKLLGQAAALPGSAISEKLAPFIGGDPVKASRNLYNHMQGAENMSAFGRMGHGSAEEANEAMNKMKEKFYRSQPSEASGNAKTSSEKLIGGEGDFTQDSEYPKKELARGKRHEMEHTHDSVIAKEIAKDHLSERADYYKALAKAKLG